MKFLGKQQILANKAQVIEQLEVPEWGGTVCIRSISARERGQIEAGIARYRETKGKEDSFARNFTLRMAGMALCDESGARLFSDEEISQLAEHNAAVIARIAEVAGRLAGFTKEDVEALAKNSEEAQPADSLSG